MAQPTRILVVDDEKNLRFTLAEILQDEGYEAHEAATGEEAVTLCEEERFDVVLLDVRMPGMDGIEAFRRIRRHHETARIILMSAYTVDDLKRAALDEGAIAFLAKPLDIQQVIALVGEVRETTILVVEPDDVSATSVRDTLRQHNYRVTVVGTAHDALELVEQIRFDIILIDTALPLMNGLELYLSIKKITPQAVAVMVTNLEEEFERIAQEAVQQTAYTILRKPLDLDELLSLLERIRGQRASGGEMRKPKLEGA
jgi:two-component system, NtrC family, response regulator HydG